MAVSILGGVGLFLLGMSVMTEGLKAVAGPSLRRVLARAAATPLRGTFWGAVVTLIVQSSSATTMTTIGLVSAGLLTFPQGLSLVFGANIGTTGTGWLVALLGVRVSLTAAALPMVFVGAMLRLLASGRTAAGGGALAGFGLLLAGLTTLQQGMSGLSELVNPADLPGVLGSEGVGIAAGLGGLLLLVLVGVVSTTVMQSSSAAIAVTLSALHAGAIDADQAVALVIGQNVGTAVSSAMAAIGTTTPARRTAIAYILFKILTAAVVLLAFPLVALIVRWASHHVDGTTLLAAFHTGYNVLGVSILLPQIDRFARWVERLVPARGPVLTKYLDDSVLAVPAVAVEASRRTLGAVMQTLCVQIMSGLRAAEAASRGTSAESGAPAFRIACDPEVLRASSEALDRARVFLSRLTEPPVSYDEQRRLSNTLHALDHAMRLVETLEESDGEPFVPHSADESNALEIASAALAEAAQFGADLASETRVEDAGAPGRVADGSARLAELRRRHRQTVLEEAGRLGIPPEQAMRRVEFIRRLDRVVYHVGRMMVHLQPS